MQIAVLGMHRSGTSALTRLLGFIGCHLGDDAEFNPVRPDNPAGDWERSDVWSLNQDILTALGATWCRVQDADTAHLKPSARTQLEARARAIAARLDAAGRPWAIKDPRMCLTFPVWRAVLREPVCVLIHRDPLSVARSLARRDGLPLAVGLALWEVHTLGALDHSRGLPRVAVAQRAVLADPVRTVATLRRDLEGHGVGGLGEGDADAVRGFVDPALSHAQPDLPAQAEHLNPAQARLAAAMEDGSALTWDRVPAGSAAARDLIAGYFNLEDRLAAMTAERDEQAQLFLHKAEEVERLAEARDAAEAVARQADALAGKVDALTRLNATLEDEHAALARKAAEAEAGRARADGAIEGVRERARRAEDDLDVLTERATQMERLIELILASRRFRYGNLAGDLLGKALLRPGRPGAAEHARRIVSAFHDVCRDIAARRAAGGAAANEMHGSEDAQPVQEAEDT